MKTKVRIEKNECENKGQPFELLNPKCEPLTVERLRQFPGMENLSDVEAESIIQSVRIFTGIIVEYTAMQQRQGNIISLSNDNYNQAA